MSVAQNINSQKPVFKTFDFELKSTEEDDDYYYFDGYLSTYGNIDRVNEVMDKGCFDEGLKKHSPFVAWIHKPDEPIGVFPIIRSDEKGLWVRGKMPKDDTLVSGRVYPQMKVKSVKAMSVGFIPQEWEYDENDVKHHTKSFLIEGSPVPFPANELAEIENVKAFGISDVEEVKTKREFEQLLRDSGAFSRKAVQYLASRFVEDEKEQSDSVVVKSFIDELETITKKLKGIKNV